MEWYKHDTSATQDAKIRKLLMYSEKVAGSGAIGYAIYFHAIELIAGGISAHNVSFELEHDSEIIADTLRIRGTSEKSGREIVEILMRYMIDIGLFESSDDRIFCYKLIRRLDSSMTSNPYFRKIISQAKERHDTVMIPSCKIDQIDQIDKIDEIDEKATPEKFHISLDGRALPARQTRYDNLVAEWGKSVIDDYLRRVIDYADSHGKRYADYAATVGTWIRKDIDAGKGPRKAHRGPTLEEMRELG